MTPRELKSAIRERLKMVHSRVYYQNAPSKAEPPYLVYDLPNAIDQGGPPEVWVLDLDGWDEGGDSGVLDALMESADSVLHRQTLAAHGARAQVYRDMRLAPITEENNRLKRRRYTYQVRVYQ